MNEIRLARGEEPLTVEVEARQSDHAWIDPDGDRGLSVPVPVPEPEFEFEPVPVPLIPEPAPEERRVAQRYPATEGRCWIGWQESGQFRQLAAWILNISVSGSLVATDTPPPLDRPIWLRLDDTTVPEWAEAKVLRIHAGRDGFHAARLVFRGTCPYAMIRAAAFASTTGRPGRPAPSASWDLNSW
jgi:hypothetical protein